MSGPDRGVSRVLVLGGTGFIGQAVVTQFARQPGLLVRAAARGARPGADAAVEVVRCDLRDPASLGRALENVDVVVNCGRERADEAEANCLIENLLTASEAAGVGHLIYLSSVAAYGGAAGAVREDTTPVAPLNWYGRAKLNAEAACRRRASDRLGITLLRPALVYGPGGAEWSLDFIRSIARGHLQGLGPAADGIANLVHVDDLAGFCVQRALRAHRGTALFTVNGTEEITFNRYFAEIATALRDAGVAPPPRRRPPLLGAYARPLIRHGLDRVRQRVTPDGALDRRLVAAQAALRRRPEDRAGARYAADTRYVPDRAIAAGLAPSTAIAEGVRQSVRWAIATGAIRGGAG